MILRFHVPFYEEILRIPDFAQDPILTFGYQDIDGDAPPGPNPLLHEIAPISGFRRKAPPRRK